MLPVDSRNVQIQTNATNDSAKHYVAFLHMLHVHFHTITGASAIWKQRRLDNQLICRPVFRAFHARCTNASVSVRRTLCMVVAFSTPLKHMLEPEHAWVSCSTWYMNNIHWKIKNGLLNGKSTLSVVVCMLDNIGAPHFNKFWFTICVLMDVMGVMVNQKEMLPFQRCLSCKILYCNMNEYR